jgi:PST family polysaccharide transporter
MLTNITKEIITNISFIIKTHSFSEYWYVYLYNFGIVIGNALFPLWLFQGLEVHYQLQYQSYIDKHTSIH